MRVKITASILGWIVGLTISFSLAAGASAASALTPADIDLLLSLGLISEEKAVAAKANLRSQSNLASPSKAKMRYLFTKDLQPGSRGADVAALQNLLGVSPATGHFGALTKAAVIKYQLGKGISPASGYVGARTRASLNAEAAAVTRP
jgi:peptidoglycan hydrolase-like protein with peptidoglycan-binding domain